MYRSHFVAERVLADLRDTRRQWTDLHALFVGDKLEQIYGEQVFGPDVDKDLPQRIQIVGKELIELPQLA